MKFFCKCFFQYVWQFLRCICLSFIWRDIQINVLPWWLRWERTYLQCRRWGSNPGWGRSPREENGNPLQYSCLENSMDTGAWLTAAHGLQSQTWLSDEHFLLHQINRKDFFLKRIKGNAHFKVEMYVKECNILVF